jgi:hypothetical protein
MKVIELPVLKEDGWRNIAITLIDRVLSETASFHLATPSCGA